MDYHPNQTLMPELLQRSRTVILRSLTKFCSMPGLRVGYAFADPDTARRLVDEAFRWESRRAFSLDAPSFRVALESLPDLDVLPGDAPFVLVHLHHHSGTKLAATLASRGLLVRTCAQWPGLGDSYLRLAVRRIPDQERLLEALAQALCKPT